MLKYPNNKKNTISRQASHANRGMNFEYEINTSNNFYANEDIAYIYKKPTPIKVVKVDYNKSKYSTTRHRISEAYYQEASTTDYNGIYRGMYIDFEAKECRYKTFNMGANLKKHQYQHLVNVRRHQGISFLFVKFTTIDKCYILETDYLKNYIEKYEKTSIPLSYFEEYGYEVKMALQPPLKYIEVLDILISKEKYEK